MTNAWRRRYNECMYRFVQNISTFLSQVGFSESDLWTLGIWVFFFVVGLLFFLKYAAALFVHIGSKTIKKIDWKLYTDILHKCKTELIVFNGVYFALLVFPLLGTVKVFFTGVYVFIFVVFIIDMIRTILINSVQVYLRSRQKASEDAILTTVSFVSVISTIILWIIAGIVVLVAANVDVEALLGSLGIVSVIVAFSFQNALKDIFAFFSIYLDRTYAVGDYVMFGEYQGTIKEIRLRSTRIKALLGNELIIPNDKLTTGTVQNFKGMARRRVSFVIHTKVVPPETLEVALKEIRELFASGVFGERVELVRVVFEAISDYGLQIRVIYRFNYIRGESNFLQHLDMKEQVNLALMKVLAKHKIALVELRCAFS